MPNTARHASLVIVLLAAACGQVLGLEEAYIDDNLSESPASTQTDGSSDTGTNSNTSMSSATTDAATAATTGGGGGPSATSSEASADTTGSTSGGGETGETGETMTTGSVDLPSLCESYCASIDEYCIGDNLQFRDLAQCLRVCSAFPEGEVGDEDQNSVACRMKYAGKARYAAGTELAAYCRQAGPGGDDRCGSNCEGLCSVMLLACTEEDAAPYFYQSFDDCISACTDLPQVEYYYGIADGNSLQCRLFHAASAAMSDPGEHCEHAFGITLCEDT